jgi:hypothetical protein
LAVEAGIDGAVDFTHATGGEEGLDAIGAQALPMLQ